MALSFASLGSGSRGNATLVKTDDCLLMVDCGFTIKETERRLASLGYQAADITSILVTHEHGDHIKGVGPFARKYQLPVYLTHGTAQYHGLSKLSALHQINLHQRFRIENIDITPVAVPHDAREPCQFVFHHQNKSMGILTDLGSITPHVIEQYQRCDALMLESNHCIDMLARGPYPPSLKQRVGGHWGHLSNHQASQLLGAIDTEALQYLVLSHISEQNNTEELARAAIGLAFDRPESLLMAEQETSSGWLTIE